MLLFTHIIKVFLNVLINLDTSCWVIRKIEGLSFCNTALVWHNSLCLKNLKHLHFQVDFLTLIHQIHTTDVVSTWCLILNKINSAKFYVGKRYFGVKTTVMMSVKRWCFLTLLFNISIIFQTSIEYLFNQQLIRCIYYFLNLFLTLYNLHHCTIILKYLFLCMCQSVLSSRS